MTNNIKNLFPESDDSALGTINTASVIRRSKARRLPMQIAAGGALALAVGGVAFAGFSGINRPVAELSAATPESSVAESATEDRTEFATDSGSSLDGLSEATAGGIKRAPADRINLCTGTVAEVAPSATGLVLTVDFADAPAGTDAVEGTVTLTNNGSEPVEGYTNTVPAVTLAQDGIVKWHSNGPIALAALEVDLEPGESLEYDASFAPVECGIEDDSAESFRDNLPALPAGEYEVSALIDLMGDFDAELISGPSSTVTLK